MRRSVACASIAMLLYSAAASSAGLDDMFQANYDKSRADFVAGCETLRGSQLAGASVVCERFPIASDKDPAEMLAVDTALFQSGHGSRLLVVQSGVHGSEAPAGSAVMSRLRDKFMQQMLIDGIDVLLIHAVNPWGYRHVRRTDEQNVNLNRNFPTSPDIYQTPNGDYDNYRGLFEPSGPVTSTSVSFMRTAAGFLGATVVHGFSSRAVSRGFNSGQYVSKNGINYGGAAPAPQTDFYKAKIKTTFAMPAYSKILVLDCHTGLGKPGVLSLIKGINPPSDLMADFEQAIGVHYVQGGGLGGQQDIGVVIHEPSDPGYFETKGDVIDFLPTLSDTPKVLALTMEFGTLGLDTMSQLQSANRMIMENQTHNASGKCGSEAVCKAVLSDFATLFNPTDEDWRSKVIAETDYIFAHIAAHY